MLLCSVVLAGCASVAETDKMPEKWSEVSRDADYPYSEIGLVYDTVFEAMTEVYYSEFPELDKAHTEPMRQYIRESCSREDFVEDMVQREAIAIFAKAKGNPEYWDTQEFQDCFEVTLNVSVAMAQMVIGNARMVYDAKYVDKDPNKLALMEMEGAEDKMEFISWVYGEVSQEEARQELGNYAFEEGDIVYGFSSPIESWEMMWGREGYLIVRDHKIVDAIVTMIN